MPEPPEKPTSEYRPGSEQGRSTIPFSGFERPPERIGPYRILEVIGEGGMGTVYLAEQEEPVRRRVALKIIKLGMDTKKVVARFEAERQALAMMDHPNIAKVFDAGATEQGRPYFVMEHITGEPITRYCDRHELTTKERLALFVQVCRAIHHAHQKAVIHRDIKPQNVLVTIEDEKPVPKIIDFGVAKATSHRLTERTVFTEQGQLIGTPEYMSPEQAEMTGLNVDTRTDIYSCGVMLYELLTSALPFEPSTLREAGLEGIQRMIREQEPPRPSTRVNQMGEGATAAAKHRRTSVSALRNQLHHELDWITMRAMDKDRLRRYQSASEFAADIERYLHDDPVMAGPPSATYRMRKFLRKHRGPVATAAAIVLTIVVLGAVALWQGVAVKKAATRLHAQSILQAAGFTDDPLLKGLLVLEVAESPGLSGRLQVARDAVTSALPMSVLRGLEQIESIAFSPDGSRIVTASSDKARVWATDGSGEPMVLDGHGGRVWSASFSPDGTRIATASSDRTARVWPADGQGEALVLEHENEVEHARFSPDGARIVTTSVDGTAWVWVSDGSGEPVVLGGDDRPVNEVAFSPDGTRIVAACFDGKACVWTVDGSGETVVLEGHEARLRGAAFSPDGTRIVTASNDGTARIWAADGEGEPVVLEGHEAEVWSAAFSPDGTRIVTASFDGTARVWAADGSGQPLILEHEGTVWEAAFSPSGEQVLTASLDGTGFIWQLTNEATEATLLHGGSAVTCGAFSPDGTLAALASYEGTVRVWRVEAKTEKTILRHSHAICVAPSADGTQLVSAGFDGVARVWRVDNGVQTLELKHGEGQVRGPVVGDAAFSPDGALIVTASTDSVVRVWRSDEANKPLVSLDHKAMVLSASFSPDGTRILTGSRDSTVQVWSVEGEGLITLQVGSEVQDANFSPDGRWIVSASYDSTVRIWPSDGSDEPVVLRGHQDHVMSASFSPDGKSVITASFDHTARVWPLEGEGESLVLRHPSKLWDATFSPDGKRIATAGTDGSIHLWRVEDTSDPLILEGHSHVAYTAVFSPDGSRVFSASYDGTVRIWDLVVWQEVLQELEESVATCLSPQERMKYLLEAPSEAWAGYSKCEQRYDRTPLASLRPE